MSESNLEDRAAIHDLFTRYCCALDNGEVEAVVDCFTVDAILKSPVIDISGRDEILAFAGCRAVGRRRDNRGRRAYTIAHGHAFLWSEQGYQAARQIRRAAWLLTPPSTLLAIRAGYRPVLHPDIEENPHF